MSVTARQSDLIKASFAQMQDRLAPASLAFYEALFRRAPGLRKLFRDDLEGQGMRFMSTLGVIVADLDRPEALTERFADLGQGHAAMGVHAADFVPMGEALIETLKQELGADFLPETEAAWRAAYADLSARIVALGRIR